VLSSGVGSERIPGDLEVIPKAVNLAVFRGFVVGVAMEDPVR